jgi:hypothetical protein
VIENERRTKQHVQINTELKPEPEEEGGIDIKRGPE